MQRDMHNCPEGKVINPKTGRCVSISYLKRLTKQVAKSDAKADVKSDPKPAVKTAKTAKAKTPKIIVHDVNAGIVKNLKILQEYETIHKEPYKAVAYEKVIDAIELYDQPIKTIDDIKNLKGVGKKIEDKILEYLATGKMHAVENALQDAKYILGKQLLNIYGIGPAKTEELMKQITSFDELKQRPELLNEKQKIGLKYYDDMQKRIPMAEGKKHYKMIEKAIKGINKEIEFEMVGSYRRKNKDMGDIDILIKNRDGLDLKTIVGTLQTSGYLIESLASGKNKFMGICRLAPNLPARRIDILIAEPEYYYFALLYFTGSYTFNIYMRRVALQKGLSLSEYGFKNLKTQKIIDTGASIQSEEDIFKYIDIPYVPPNKR